MDKTKEKTTDFYMIQIMRPNQLEMTNYNMDDRDYTQQCRNVIRDYIVDLNNNIDPSIEYGENFVEIINSDQNYAFGIIGKSNSVERGIMRRIKDKQGNEVKETDYLEENLKYFVIRLSDLSISIIRNSLGPNVAELFCNFIKTALNDTFPHTLVYLNPIIDEHIPEKINRMRKLCKLKVKFMSDSSLSKDALSLSELFDYDKNNIISTSFEIKFKNQIMPSKFKEFLDNEGNKSHFEKFEITSDDGEMEQTIEVIKRHLMKKVSLDLSDDELTNANQYLDKIKKALISSFD